MNKNEIDIQAILSTIANNWELVDFTKTDWAAKVERHGKLVFSHKNGQKFSVHHVIDEIYGAVFLEIQDPALVVNVYDLCKDAPPAPPIARPDDLHQIEIINGILDIANNEVEND